MSDMSPEGKLLHLPPPDDQIETSARLAEERQRLKTALLATVMELRKITDPVTGDLGIAVAALTDKRPLDEEMSEAGKRVAKNLALSKKQQEELAVLETEDWYLQLWRDVARLEGERDDLEVQLFNGDTDALERWRKADDGRTRLAEMEDLLNRRREGREERPDMVMKKLAEVAAQLALAKQEEGPISMEALEKKLNLREEYDAQKKLLIDAGIVSELPQSKGLGIVGIDGKEYPLPTYEQVKAAVARHKDVVNEKWETEGRSFLLVPFGMSLIDLIKKVAQFAIKKQENKAAPWVYSKSENRTRRTGLFKESYLEARHYRINKEQPFGFRNEAMERAIVNGALIYDPQFFNQNQHDGNTKKEILKNMEQSSTPGWCMVYGEAWFFENTLSTKPINSTSVKIKQHACPLDQPAQASLAQMRLHTASEVKGLTPETWLIFALKCFALGRAPVGHLMTGCYDPSTNRTMTIYFETAEPSSDTFSMKILDTATTVLQKGWRASTEIRLT